MRRPRPPLAASLALLAAAAVCAAGIALRPRPAAGEEAPAKGLAALSWLEGGWEGENRMGRWETSYTSSAGGSMLSSMKLTGGGKEKNFDFERWREEGGTVVMTPFPRGAASVDFKATSVDGAARRVVLENPEHDFPKKFTYESPSKDALKITLEGEEGGHPQKMVFELKRRKAP
jgi:hypothetical protein